MPCSALNTPEEFVADQRRDERHPLGTLTHAELGRCEVPGAPLHVDGVFHAADLVAVAAGADTDAVFIDELGHRADEVARWREDGLV
jgi:crotonobetainyl-CoA:carnitine CoA-transferase CaiB-like acyl-CoA transferase